MATPSPRLLVIDDDEEELAITRRQLERVYADGFELDWASSYDDALEAIGRGGHDAVLVDYRLGGRDGLRLIREAREAGCRTPLILLSGLAEHSVDVAAMEAGASDFLVKQPLDPATLERSLRYAIQRKRSEEDLLRAKVAAEAASRAKGAFLANMSHEVRTPMNAIIGMAELLIDSDLVAIQREYAATIRSSAEALLALLNDVLDYSRVEAGRLSLCPVPFDMADVAEEVADLLAPGAHRKGLRFTCRLDPNLPEVLIGDPVRLRQVLINLVSNAVKFTDTGEVVVEVRLLHETTTDATVHIGVTDTGIGVPAENHAAVFEVFEQAGCDALRRRGGAGLGLAICRRLVDLMKGQIGLESRGQGSTFWIELTLPQAVETGRTRRKRDGLLGLHVLIADSDRNGRRALREQLTGWGCRVAEVDDGHSALDVLRAASATDPFSVALLELGLPTDGARATAAAIRGDAGLVGTQLVALCSAGTAESCRVDSEVFGITLIKPVRRANLYQALTGLERGRRALLFPAKPGVVDAGTLDLNVLVAEDHEANRRVIVHMLERLRCRAVTVGDGRAAVEALARTAFDVVLMDIQMPVLDGLQAIAAIRRGEQCSGRHVPIIAMTAHAMEEDRERCFAAGADAYLAKPVRRRELYETLLRLAPGNSTEALAAPGPQAEGTELLVERLLEDHDGDTALVRAVVGAYLTDVPKMIAAIESGIDSGKLERARAEAHGLRGDSLTVGAERIASICLELETAARTGDASRASLALPVLKSEWSASRTELQQLLVKWSGSPDRKGLDAEAIARWSLLPALLAVALIGWL